MPVVLGVLLFISRWLLGFAGVMASAWVLAVPVAGSVLLVQDRTASVAH